MKFRRLSTCGAILALFFFISHPARATIAEILHAQGFHDGKIFRPHGANADLIKVEINGHPMKLLIDTGAATTVLWRDTAREAHIAAGRDLGLAGGLNGTADAHASLAVISSFKINGVELSPAPVVIVNNPANEAESSAYDGILGLITMKKNQVFFGYNPAVFYFRSNDPGPVANLDAFLLGHGFARVSLTPEEAKYHFELTLNGVVGDVVLDSGAFGTLIREDFARRAGLMQSREQVMGAGLNGTSFVSTIVRPRRIAIGPLVLPTLPLAAGSDAVFNTGPHGAWPGDGCVGFDLIGRLYPLLDTVDDCLYLWPAPHG